MTLQFRKSKTRGPLRATVSKHGVGISAGTGPLRYSLGADGKTRRTMRIPGTGIYATQVVGEGESKPTAEKRRHPWLTLAAVLSVSLLLLVLFI